MTTPGSTQVRPPDPAGASTSGTDALRGDPTKRQIRGSSLLLSGRMLSLVVNFATQILIVRYLSKSDFGAFAYGLSIVSLGESLSLLGLDKAISRFLPIYDEHGAHGKLFGTLLMVLGSVLVFGLAFVLVAIGLNGFAGGSLADSSEAQAAVLILAGLAPVQALDSVFMGAFAVFSKPRAIFFRKYVLAPGLRLAAILLVVLSHEGVRELAIGYVLSGVAGIALYAFMLVQTFRTDGLLAKARASRLSFPAREVFGFAVPLVAVDLLFVVMNTTNVWMLQHFGNVNDVADYRVVQPAAKLNTLVFTSFAMLFTPLAARYFARESHDGVRQLYWRTAAWIAVFSFPIFALTFSSAQSLTVLLFGERYSGSAPILALLAVGYYVNAALGFNGLTLRVYGLVRFTVWISIIAAVANVAVNLALIPAYGAVGAAIGTCATLVAHNVLKQTGLRRFTGVGAFDREHARVYGVIVAASVLLMTIQIVIDPIAPVSLALAALATATVFYLTRDTLRVGDTFPELTRVPLLGKLVS